MNIKGWDQGLANQFPNSLVITVDMIVAFNYYFHVNPLPCTHIIQISGSKKKYTFVDIQGYPNGMRL